MKDVPPKTDMDANEPKVLRRDWIVLPLLGLLTICLLFGVLKSFAGHDFRAYGNIQQHCLSFQDAVHGAHGIPNSICSAKLAEGEPVEYRFNHCGNRTGIECGTKAPGSYRIVAVGSSFLFGLSVPQDQTFAGLLPASLSRKTGARVELYNESELFTYVHNIDTNFNQVLAAEPDMILWVVTPYDVKEASMVLPPKVEKIPVAGVLEPGPDASYLERVRHNLKVSFTGGSFWQGVSAFRDRELAQFEGGTVALMLQHYLYLSQSQYVKAYLVGGEGDRDTMFLRTDPSVEWKDTLKQFDAYAASIANQAKAAGKPLVVVMIPQRGQAAMISMGAWPDGFDPYKLNNELRSMIVSHGGTYVDILPGFRQVPNPEQYFLSVDGHPTAAGHALISRLLLQELTGGSVPALQVQAPTQNAKE